MRLELSFKSTFYCSNNIVSIDILVCRTKYDTMSLALTGGSRKISSCSTTITSGDVIKLSGYVIKRVVMSLNMW